MKEENVIVEKSFAFALRIIGLYKYLNGKKEFVMSTQLLKSGTSVGANTKEAIRAQSKKDFIAKMNIALKEISETEYWIELLHKSDYIDKIQFDSINADCSEIIKILMAIIKSSKNNCEL